MTIPISVLIPTRNEERNLAACLESVAWAGERVVFDSYSDDRTLEIAAAHGARVVQRTFDNFSSHKNWALEHIDFAHPWVLILDADERVTPALAKEISALFVRGPQHNGYYLARKIIWRGRWLRYGGRYPDYNLRLIRHGYGRYEPRLVHEHMVVDGSSVTWKHRWTTTMTRGWSATSSVTTTIRPWRRWRLCVPRVLTGWGGSGRICACPDRSGTAL